MRNLSGVSGISFLLFCLVIGAALRFSFPADIEYKGDQQYTVAALESYRSGGHVPALGMMSSAGIRNPGLSVWVFLLLGKLSGARDPIQLARAVAALNVAALGVLIFMVRRVVDEAEREAWGWAAALFAVNTFNVVFSRIIWAQSTVPFFSIILLCAWFYRDRRMGASLWGLLSAIISQVHLAGFFFAAGLLLWSGLVERQSQHPKKARWRYMLGSAAIGFLPLAPWIQQFHPGHLRTVSWSNLISFRYWIEWAETALDIGLWHSLGPAQFIAFLRWPLVNGQSTYVVLALHVAIVIAALVLVSSHRVFLDKNFWRRLAGAESETTLINSAGAWGVGLLMTAAAIPIYLHYLIVVYPLPWLWLGLLGNASGREGRLSLAIIWCCQLTLSILFLCYIHTHHGAATGDFGIAYGYQSR